MPASPRTRPPALPVIPVFPKRMRIPQELTDMIIDALAAALTPPSPVSPCFIPPASPSVLTSTALSTSAPPQSATSLTTSDTKHALLRTALVAAPWMARSQKHLFRRVCLRGTSRFAGFAAFVAAHPRIARLVQHLVLQGIRGPGEEETDGESEASRKEEGDNATRRTRSRASSPSISPNRDGSLPPALLASLLAHLPNLKSVQLHDVYFHVPVPTPLRFSPLHPALPPLPPPAYTERPSPAPPMHMPPPAYSLLPPSAFSRPPTLLRHSHSLSLPLDFPPLFSLTDFPVTLSPPRFLSLSPAPPSLPLRTSSPSLPDTSGYPAAPASHPPTALDELIIMNAGSPQDTTDDVLRILRLFGRVRSLHLSAIEQEIGEPEDTDADEEGADGDEDEDGQNDEEEDETSDRDRDPEKYASKSFDDLTDTALSVPLRLTLTTLKLEDVAADAYLRALTGMRSVRTLRSLEVACSAVQDARALSRLLRAIHEPEEHGEVKAQKGGRKETQKQTESEKGREDVAYEEGDGDAADEGDESGRKLGVDHLMIDLAQYLQIEYIQHDAEEEDEIVIPDSRAMYTALTPGLASCAHLHTLTLGAMLGSDPAYHGVAWECVEGVLAGAPTGMRRVALELSMDPDFGGDDDSFDGDGDEDEDEDEDEEANGGGPSERDSDVIAVAAADDADGERAADPWAGAFVDPGFARIAAACARFDALERVSFGIAPGSECVLSYANRVAIENAFKAEGLECVLSVEA